jgi:mono/diheme cytochrome c family protein
MMKILRSIALLIAIAAVTWSLLNSTIAQSASEKWVAPAGETGKKSPIPSTEGSIAAGHKVYTSRCAGCHGTSGNGDGPDAADLGIHPAKLSQVAGEESDGALFWKITTGKKPMPSFGAGNKRLSEADRWNVINYIRTLARK